MPTRRTLLLGASALSLSALAACAPATPSASPTGPSEAPTSAAPTPLTVGLTYIPNVQFSPFYVGVDEGIFAAAGLDLAIRHHGAQEDVFGALVAGREDVVFASSDEAVVASTQTPALRTFATAYQRFPGVVVAPAASGVASMADLRGRRVGIPGHFGSTYYAALVALHGAGMTEADVQLTDIGFTQVAALQGGKVEAIVGYSNNEPVQCRLAGLDVTVLPVQDPAEPTLVGPGLITLADRLPADVLRRLAAAMAEAERRIVDDPALALDATARQVPTLADPDQRKAAEAVLAATVELWKRDGEVSVAVDEAAFGRMGEFLVQAGIIDRAPAETVIAL